MCGSGDKELPDVVDRHTLAMQAIVEYAKMRRFCMLRTTCKGCPYWSVKACTAATTEGVLLMTAKVFEAYMFMESLKEGSTLTGRPLSLCDDAEFVSALEDVCSSSNDIE